MGSPLSIAFQLSHLVSPRDFSHIIHRRPASQVLVPPTLCDLDGHFLVSCPFLSISAPACSFSLSLVHVLLKPLRHLSTSSPSRVVSRQQITGIRLLGYALTTKPFIVNTILKTRRFDELNCITIREQGEHSQHRSVPSTRRLLHSTPQTHNNGVDPTVS